MILFLFLFLFPFLFLPSGIMSKSIMVTHNLQDFTLGDPMWYLEPPTLPLRPQDVLTHVRPIETMWHLPLGPSNTPPISRPAPLPPTETGGKATKTTTNTIYMISSTSFPSISSAVEDPPDLPQHHLCDDEDICKTTSGFTPFPLNLSVESVLSIKDQILSPFLANDLFLGKGAYLFVDSDGKLLEDLRNGLYLKRFYA